MNINNLPKSFTEDARNTLLSNLYKLSKENKYVLVGTPVKFKSSDTKVAFTMLYVSQISIGVKMVFRRLMCTMKKDIFDDYIETFKLQDKLDLLNTLEVEGDFNGEGKPIFEIDRIRSYNIPISREEITPLDLHTLTADNFTEGIDRRIYNSLHYIYGNFYDYLNDISRCGVFIDKGYDKNLEEKVPFDLRQTLNITHLEYQNRRYLGFEMFSYQLSGKNYKDFLKLIIEDAAMICTGLQTDYSDYMGILEDDVCLYAISELLLIIKVLYTKYENALTVQNIIAISLIYFKYFYINKKDIELTISRSSNKVYRLAHNKIDVLLSILGYNTEESKRIYIILKDLVNLTV